MLYFVLALCRNMTGMALSPMRETRSNSRYNSFHDEDPAPASMAGYAVHLLKLISRQPYEDS